MDDSYLIRHIAMSLKNCPIYLEKLISHCYVLGTFSVTDEYRHWSAYCSGEMLSAWMVLLLQKSPVGFLVPKSGGLQTL